MPILLLITFWLGIGFFTGVILLLLLALWKEGRTNLRKD